MNVQMTIFDILYPKRLNPIEEVARQSRPYWTTSRQKLIGLCNTDPDIKVFSKAVRREYCPHGFAGHRGFGNGPNSLYGWDMTPKHIKTYFYDAEEKKCERLYSWNDFAVEISMLIWSDDYMEDD